MGKLDIHICLATRWLAAVYIEAYRSPMHVDLVRDCTLPSATPTQPPSSSLSADAPSSYLCPRLPPAHAPIFTPPSVIAHSTNNAMVSLYVVVTTYASFPFLAETSSPSQFFELAVRPCSWLCSPDRHVRDTVMTLLLLLAFCFAFFAPDALPSSAVHFI